MKRQAEPDIGAKTTKSKHKERPQADEEAHGRQLNGLTYKAPPWPQSQLKNENMFILPTRFKSQDSISVTGVMQNDPRILTVGLITGYSSADYENLACQLEISYPPSNEDKITIKTIKDGYHQVINDSNPTSGYLNDIDFKVMFLMREDRYIDIHINDLYLEQIELKHSIDEIRFLSVSGDVNKVNGLDFQFG